MHSLDKQRAFQPPTDSHKLCHLVDVVFRALRKLRKEYPEFVTYVTKHDIEHVRTPILSAFYGQNPIPARTNLTWLKGIDTDEFLNKTYSGKIGPGHPRTRFGQVQEPEDFRKFSLGQEQAKHRHLRSDQDLTVHWP